MARAQNKSSDDPVYSTFYEPHLSGGRMRNSPHRNRLRLHENVNWRILTELSANRFKWWGLPESVDERFLELGLLRSGGMLFWWYDDPDKYLGSRYLVSRFTVAGHNNHYDNPSAFQPIATSLEGVPKVDSKSGVPIWSNYLRTPDMDIIYLYASKLAQIDTTIEINISASRHTKVVAAEENQRLTMENIARQQSEGIPTIYVNGAFDSSTLQALDLGPHHETLPNLLVTRHRIYDECLSLLGVSAVNDDKAERMITGEVESAEDQAKVTRNIALRSRQQAAEQINRLFPDLSISVDWASSTDPNQSDGQAGGWEEDPDTDRPDGSMGPDEGQDQDREGDRRGRIHDDRE